MGTKMAPNSLHSWLLRFTRGLTVYKSLPASFSKQFHFFRYFLSAFKLELFALWTTQKNFREVKEGKLKHSLLIIIIAHALLRSDYFARLDPFNKMEATALCPKSTLSNPNLSTSGEKTSFPGHFDPLKIPRNGLY